MAIRNRVERIRHSYRANTLLSSNSDVSPRYRSACVAKTRYACLTLLLRVEKRGSSRFPNAEATRLSHKNRLRLVYPVAALNKMSPAKVEYLLGVFRAEKRRQTKLLRCRLTSYLNSEKQAIYGQLLVPL